VPEELALGELVGQRGAVDGDQWSVAALAPGVHLGGDQLLAHPRLTDDEDGEGRGRHQRHLVEHAPGRGAHPEEPPGARLARPVPQILRLACDRGLEGIDEASRAQRRGRDPRQHPEQLRIEPVEGVGGERIDHQRTHRRLLVVERAAEAGVDAVVAAGIDQQGAVERIGQGAVGGEPHRERRAEHGVEPRVLRARVAPRERRGQEPVARQRHQRVALEPEQAGRVAGDHTPHRLQQPLVAIGSAQARGEVRAASGGRRGGLRACHSIDNPVVLPMTAPVTGSTTD
jgi:hypothetical protein